MMEFLCWLKAVLLTVAVVGSYLFACVFIIGLIGGIIWLGSKVSETVEDYVPRLGDIAFTGFKVILVILLGAAVLGGIYAGKRKVCTVGFKQAYVESMKWATTPDTPKK
jgi:hypothetical protein